MLVSPRLRIVLAAVLLLATSASAVRADVIDGDWCDEGGRHFSIKGPEIVTPEGAKTTGDYSRHAFSYTSPQAGASNGEPVFMRLVNESTVHLRRGTDPSVPVQVWRRCEPVS